MATNTGDYQGFANNVAGQFGLNSSIFSWMIGQESGWNPDAQNGNAVGIAQFMPGTAKDMGLQDRTDPYSSIYAAGQYLSGLVSKFNGDYTKALKAYGTLANVPQSVTDSYNKVASGSSDGETSTAPNTTQGTKSSIQIDSFIPRIAIGLLALIVIAGAIYTYKG